MKKKERFVEDDSFTDSKHKVIWSKSQVKSIQAPGLPRSFKLIFLKLILYLEHEIEDGKVTQVSDVLFGQFCSKSSFIHRLDPRTKLLSCFFLSMTLIITTNAVVLGLLLIVLGLAFGLSRMPLHYLLQSLRWFGFLIAITFVLHILNIRTTGSFPFWAVSLSEQGMKNAGVYTTRILLVIGFTTLLTMTTSPTDLTSAIERLLAPLRYFRLPVQQFSLAVSLSLRFVPILLREGERIRNSVYSRGVAFEGSLRSRIHCLVPMVVPLLVSVFQRADELALAMESRCYSGERERTNFITLRLKSRDYAVCLGAVLVLCTALLY